MFNRPPTHGNPDSPLKDQDIDPAARAAIEKACLEVKEGERLTDQLARQYD